MRGASVAWDGSRATVVRDGYAQSCIDVDDPTRLSFEYMQHLAMVLRTLPEGPLRVTHVGGAGLSMPRWVQATRPGSPQIVFEPDADLTDLVRREVPLPRRHRIRVRPMAGETGVAALADASADALILDAYVDGRVPAVFATTPWHEQVARVLGPSGLYLANLADGPGLGYVARVAASAASAFGHLAVIGLNDVVKGRRFGNLVLLASQRALDLDSLRRATASAPLPTGLMTGTELARRRSGATAFRATDAAPSPAPPARFFDR